MISVCSFRVAFYVLICNSGLVPKQQTYEPAIATEENDIRRSGPKDAGSHPVQLVGVSLKDEVMVSTHSGEQMTVLQKRSQLVAFRVSAEEYGALCREKPFDPDAWAGIAHCLHALAGAPAQPVAA